MDDVLSFSQAATPSAMVVVLPFSYLWNNRNIHPFNDPCNNTNLSRFWLHAR